MSSCDHFTQNAWRPDLCSTCQRSKSEHEDGSGSGSSRSWRRRSEPNPNNVITGVRITALASKFQGREARSGSIPETEAERAKTLDRKTTKPKEKKLNVSRSTELLDSSRSSSSSSSSASSSSSSNKTATSAISSLSTQSSRGKYETTPLRSLNTKSKVSVQTSSAISLSSSSSTSATTVTSSAEKTTHSTTIKSKSSAPYVNTQTSVRSQQNSKDSRHGQSSIISKSNLSQQSDKESTKKSGNTGISLTSSSSSSSETKPSSRDKRGSSSSPPPPALKTVNPDKSSTNGKEKSDQRRKVSIPDLEPEVIGSDGGIDNLIPEEEAAGEDGGDSDHIYFSLTDEEKQFALLALGNTVWNSDTRNLQVEPEAAKRACREFEDLEVNKLWDKDKFQSLVDCDALKASQDFGTFPQINSSKQSRVSLENLNFSADSSRNSNNVKGKRSVRPSDSDNMKDQGKVSAVTFSNSKSQGHAQVDRLKSEGSSGTSGNSSMTSLSSDGEGKGNYGSSGGSADSGVEMGSGSGGSEHKERRLSYTVGDITDCLYETPDEVGTKNSDVKGDGHNQGQSNKTSVQGQGVKVISKKSSLSASQSMSMDEDDDPGNFDISLNDSTTVEGFQAIALLNDVLRDYGDFNESSTDDFDTKDSKKEGGKGKKSTDFEARMASVAATLDLTKQQRGKRQAPRPPVSPPPEPTVGQGISPKKTSSSQPDPVFKMVPVGKSIVTLPPQQDVPKNAKPSQAPLGLEEFGSVSDGMDSANNRANGDGKSKKGITSFFRNILRRGKDSSESFEALNPDVQLNPKLERKDSSGVGVSNDSQDDDGTSVDRKLGPKFSPQAKFLVIPPTSPPNKRGDGSTGGTTPSGADGSTSPLIHTKTDSESHQSSGIATTASSSSAAATVAPTSVTNASPPTQRKTSKGLASPKMMLKKATAKFSPPTSRHAMKNHDKDHGECAATSSSSLASSTKPYPAPKPMVPPPGKPATTSTTSLPATASAASTATSKESVASTKDKDTSSAPSVVRRRPKSPKRTVPPPVPPTRTSVGPGKGASSDSRNVDLTKELEWRLSRSGSEQSGGGTLSRSELRESTRRSMPVPPSPPGERKDKSPAGTSGRPVSPSPPISPIRETENSLPSSPSSPTGAFEFSNTEWSGGSNSTIEDELPKFTEKIELPTVANQGRKGFLGKLGGNRKTRAPQPPSVKRAKSITESSTLPRGDKKSKKINVADISGPVMVTDITNTKVLENRRNTISLGDEPAFGTGSSAQAGTISTTSIEKGGFDEFDFPVLSPLGSLENLYESILPKQEAGMFHYYDPPTSPKVLCPNIPADGYLEPVPPLSSTLASAAASSSTASSTTITTSTTQALSNMSSSSSSSSASSATTNTSVLKSPLKAKSSAPKFDPSSATFLAISKDSASPHSSRSTSASSSGTNSAENSGNSLPDSSQISSRLHVDSASSAKTGGSVSSVTSGKGANFVEPELTEQRRLLLASQPIYEEIPNGGNEDADEFDDDNVITVKEDDKKRKMSAPKTEPLSKKSASLDSGGGSMQKVMLPGMSGGGEMSKSQIAHAWLQQPHSGSATAASSTSVPSLGALPPSPSHTTTKQQQQHAAPTSLSLSSSTSQMTASSIMTASLTSSMLPPPPPPPDHLPAPHPAASRSVSRETVSSESDTQSNCSTLSRPRPAPRRKPKRPDTGGSDQYVSMNRPNAQVSLSEDKLRDVFTKVTSITFHALQDIYAQCERILSVDKLDIPNSKLLKWADFDIYGQPLHASGRCVVYNAKLRINSSPCQIMILHSRPATEMCTTSHPSLLRPSAVFADTIPFSFLTPDFIKTSQLLQNSVYDSSQARCFVAVGAFDVVESLDSHLALLRETLAQDLNSYMNVILTAALQLLSAMSHCLDQGFSVTETDYNDVFLITRSDLRGKVVAFLPHQRSLDVPQGEAMCNFLDRLLMDAIPSDDDDDLDEDDEDDDDDEEDGEKIISSPKKIVAKLRSLLEPRRVECLGQVRTAVEYLLWGPAHSELPLSPVGGGPKLVGGAGGGASKEQELYVWLEKERVSTVGRLARNVPGLGAGLSLEEFYTLKFLLKSSAACLAESLRRLSR